MRSWLACWLVAGMVLLGGGRAGRGDDLAVGFAETDVTPDVAGKKPVWIAGYGQNRRAAGVHDPLMARAVVFKQGEKKLALVTAAVVGLQYPFVRNLRTTLTDFYYVMASATHNHEGPDTMGLWGPSPFRTGIDEAYMELLTERMVAAVRAADSAAVPARAAFGSAQDDTLVRDSRLPEVKDGVLRTLVISAVDDNRRLGVLLQFSSHPEAMGSDNTQITADFPGFAVAKLKQAWGCPVAYFTGAVGGLMAPPRDIWKNSAGELLREGQFEYCQAYGEAVADLALRAAQSAAPIELTPLQASSKTIAVPLANPLYKMARSMGILKRDGRVWMGDPEQLGELMTPKDRAREPAAETEVAYLRLGELHVACIPGEIYPEMVYGTYQDPVEANVDFPEAPLEKCVAEILPGPRWLLLGLANDELGYILPRRQFDQQPPFAYGRTESQYGEENSVGPEVGPILMQALERRVREATQ